jgi:hypothetical protein
MASTILPGITCKGNPYSQRVNSSPVFPRLVQRDFSAKSRFLGRPRLLTRFSAPSEREGALITHAVGQLLDRKFHLWKEVVLHEDVSHQGHAYDTSEVSGRGN